MSWVEVFAVFLVCHLVGDFALQTQFQARNKFGGLGRDPRARRALLTHGVTYTLAFVPAFVWLWPDHAGMTALTAVLLFVTHVAEDDGRLLHLYMRRVKHTDPAEHPLVALALDQTLHVVILFGLALLVLA